MINALLDFTLQSPFKSFLKNNDKSLSPKKDKLRRLSALVRFFIFCLERKECMNRKGISEGFRTCKEGCASLIV